MTTTATTSPQNVLNGVNVDQLTATTNSVQVNLDLAHVQFRATTTWTGGAQSRTTIQSFYRAGQADNSRNRPFYLINDEPPVLLGTNTGPNAAELILAALASSLTVSFIYTAAVQGIEIGGFELSLQGDLNLQGFLGLSCQVRPGYQNLRVSCRVRSDASRAQLEALCRSIQKTSPVLDVIRNPVPVTVELED